METFEHPNMHNFECPICKTNDDKAVVLVAMEGTEEGNNYQAIQVHLDCIELVLYRDMLIQKIK